MKAFNRIAYIHHYALEVKHTQPDVDVEDTYDITNRGEHLAWVRVDEHHQQAYVNGGKYKLLYFPALNLVESIETVKDADGNLEGYYSAFHPVEFNEDETGNIGTIFSSVTDRTFGLSSDNTGEAVFNYLKQIRIKDGLELVDVHYDFTCDMDTGFTFCFKDEEGGILMMTRNEGNWNYPALYQMAQPHAGEVPSDFTYLHTVNANGERTPTGVYFHRSTLLDRLALEQTVALNVERTECEIKGELLSLSMVGKNVTFRRCIGTSLAWYVTEESACLTVWDVDKRRLYFRPKPDKTWYDGTGIFNSYELRIINDINTIDWSQLKRIDEIGLEIEPTLPVGFRRAKNYHYGWKSAYV